MEARNSDISTNHTSSYYDLSEQLLNHSVFKSSLFAN
jgi:hypothetical protein